MMSLKLGMEVSSHCSHIGGIFEVIADVVTIGTFVNHGIDELDMKFSTHIARWCSRRAATSPSSRIWPKHGYQMETAGIRYSLRVARQIT